MKKSQAKFINKYDHFDKFEINQEFKHYQGKTLTEGEESFFSLMTMNHHPIHIDTEYAKKTMYKKNVIVGTYLISLAAGMSVRDITINSVAALEYKNIKHHFPAFVGDTVYAVSTITDKIKKKNDKGILLFKTDLYNQKNIKLISMSRANLFLLK